MTAAYGQRQVTVDFTDMSSETPWPAIGAMAAMLGAACVVASDP